MYFAAALAVIPNIVAFSSGAPAPPRATWCQPLRVFNPVTDLRTERAAGQDWLAANGFPPRPPASRPDAVRLWLNVISRARRFVAPDPVCGTSRGRRATVYSGNWGGHVVPKSDYGNASFTATQSEWVQPAVPADSGYTNYNNAPAVSLWTGVGVTNLMQAGADSIATATPRYKFWTEDYPQNIIWEGPAIGPGQTAYVYTENVGGNQAHYFLENVTTGVYSAFINALPYVGTDAANFVIERPDGDYLPSFSPVTVKDNHFWQNHSSYQLTSANVKWIMTSSCGPRGTVLTAPSEVSGGQFTDDWSHSRPVANNC
jgi:hypothetical protein